MATWSAATSDDVYYRNIDEQLSLEVSAGRLCSNSTDSICCGLQQTNNKFVEVEFAH